MAFRQVSTATTERSDHTRLGFRTLLGRGRVRGAPPAIDAYADARILPTTEAEAAGAAKQRFRSAEIRVK